MSDDTLRVVMMRFAQLYFVIGRGFTSRRRSRYPSVGRAGVQTKKPHLAQLLIRMFNTMFVGVDVLGDPQYTNFGRDIVFSADLCYNEMGDENG